MKNTRYILKHTGLPAGMRIAVLADLHEEPAQPVLARLKAGKPDLILMPGDIFERLDGRHEEQNGSGYRLMRGAAKLAPVFYSPGNHENGGVRSWSPKWRHGVGIKEYYAPECLQRIRNSGAVFLNNRYVVRGGIAFGGLSSGLIRYDMRPDVVWLEEFCRVDAPRVLLCHHPEYYEPYLKDLPIDLIVSGHAHGGQWRFFGRGVFAPGQGLFPKYTSGVHDGRFVISTGMKSGRKIPRLFNEPEIVWIET